MGRYSIKAQTGLFQASLHQGQDDFLNHPVTKATANGLLFVATGGIEGVMSLGSAGVKVFTATSTSVKEAARATAEKAVGTLAGGALNVMNTAQDAAYSVGTYVRNTTAGKLVTGLGTAAISPPGPSGFVSAFPESKDISNIGNFVTSLRKLVADELTQKPKQQKNN